MQNKKITAQDIADKLNISRNTVSKALNNTGNISEDTKMKVIQTAFEMGYKNFCQENKNITFKSCFLLLKNSPCIFSFVTKTSLFSSLNIISSLLIILETIPLTFIPLQTFSFLYKLILSLLFYSVNYFCYIYQYFTFTL